MKKDREDDSSSQEREKSPPRHPKGRKRKNLTDNMSSAASTCSEDSERSNDFFGELHTACPSNIKVGIIAGLRSIILRCAVH